MTVSEEELLTALSMAAKCAILAPAVPQRSRILGDGRQRAPCVLR